jgi:hypothetical protein
VAKQSSSRRAEGGGGEQGGDRAAKDPSTDLRAETLNQVRGKADMYIAVSGLPFSVRDGGRTAFDHRTKPGTVILGVEQLHKLGIAEPDLIDFCVLHELGHFFELSQDPKGFMSVIAEGERADGLGKSYFRFYNAVMDIYVNRNTLNNAPVYGDSNGDYSQEIRQLYTEKLFPERDLTKLPLSTQYSYALLNIGMQVGDDLVVSPEVRQALDESFMHFGEELTTQEIIETYLVPAIGIRNTDEWQAKISERKGIVDATFRKRFEALIKADLQNGQDPNQGQSAGDLEGFEASPEDLRQATKQAQEIQREANKSDKEKQADAREKAVNEQAQKHLSPEQAQDLAQTHRRVYDQIVQVAQIFKEIVRQEVDHRLETQGHFKTGAELDMEEVVEQFPTIMRNPTEAKVMLKDVYEEVIVEQPKHVRVWPVLDLSGSMSDDIKLVRDLCVVFSGAAQTITLEAEMNDQQLRASLGVIGYNDGAFEILPYTERPTYEDIAKGYGKLVAAGGTYEAPALRMVAQKIKGLGRDESVVDIVIVVTDGDTTREDESQTAIKRLKEELGAKVIAFQFSRGYQVADTKPQDVDGDMDKTGRQSFVPPPPESGTFGRIWGPDGHAIRGAYNVVPKVRDALRDLLGSGS